MKYLIPILLLIGFSVKAQESKEFKVDGKVKQTLVVSLDSLKKYPMLALDSMVIYNHKMERKSTIKNIKGVLLKDILSKVEIDSPTPTALSEYYLVCTATDGYKVVLSWNEVFNSKSKDNILVLYSFDVDPKKAEKGNIAMIAPMDVASGRRYVKGLSKITILRVN